MPQDLRAGASTYWRSFGSGAQTAVMIHCSLAHSGSWAALAEHLADELTMTAFDMPGHGRSAPWEGAGEIQAHTAQIAASFCDAPCLLIGHSFGATVALRLAFEQPERVAGLVLIEPVFFAAAMADAPEIWAEHARKTEAFEAAWDAGDTHEAARHFTQLWGDGTPWEALSEPVRATLASQMHLIVAAGHALHDDPAGMLADGALSALHIPSLLIEGSASPPVIGAVQDSLAQRLPHATRARIDGAGHMAPLTHAGAVAEVIRTWRAGL